MCYNTKQSREIQELEKRFNAKRIFDNAEAAKGIFNGFTHPLTPVICNDNKEAISLAEWGLMPGWADREKFKANTLNAKIETLSEKASFKAYVKNRCLVLVDGFWEWKWLDEKGKLKDKYYITMQDNAPFAMAGIYSDWVDKDSGELTRTYSIITTEANELMAEIHNTKKRMPAILTAENENEWIAGSDYNLFKTPIVNLKAEISDI